MAERSVDPQIVIDIDHNSGTFLRDRYERYGELRARCPVAFNQHYDGYWLVTDYAGVAQVARDNETFAHKYEPNAPDGIDYHGICGVPRKEGVPQQGVSEIDGPDHADLRRVLNPFFTPQTVERDRPHMEAVASWFVDTFIETGTCDLVLDYATPVPAVLTLELMGMPSHNWKYYADFFHATASHSRDSVEFQSAVAKWSEMMAELLEFADHRRSNPGDDLTTHLVNSTLNGRPITDVEIGRIMWNLVAGGLDTTTSLVSWGLYHLGTHPEDRRRIIDDPSLLDPAIEEFLRFYSPSETLTRTTTRDVEVGGVTIPRGDVVMISWTSANRDPSMFDAPEDVRIDRPDNKHIAFGLGGHRCIGSHVARTESKVMIAEILRRIPDYELDLDGFRPYPGNVLMSGVVQMPATFTPRSRVGGDSPPF